MKNLFPAAKGVLSLVLFLSASGASAQNREPKDCPQTQAEWFAWKQEQLSRPTTVDETIREMGPFLERCASQPAQKKIFSDPKFQKCMNRVERFWGVNRPEVTQLVPQVSHGDENEDGAVGLPQSFFEDEVLLNLTAANTTPQDRRKWMQKLIGRYPGASAVEFASGVVPGDKDTIVGRIPRPAGEVWFHMVRSPDSSSAYHGMLVLSLRNVDKNGKRLAVAEMNFEIHDFNHSSRQMATLKPNTAGCMSCHRTGAVSVVPAHLEQGQVLVSSKASSLGEAVQALNNVIGDNALANHPGFSMGDFGPALGPLMERTDAELARLWGGPLPVSPEKMREGMQCSSCHNDPAKGGAGPISYPILGDDPKDVMFSHFIRSGHMPVDPRLNPKEREVLEKLLRAEYYGGFTDQKLSAGNTEPGLFLKWLRDEASCSAASSGASESVVESSSEEIQSTR